MIQSHCQVKRCERPSFQQADSHALAPSDSAQRKSSVEATEDTPSPEMSFAQFDYRDAGMLGEVPDMDRHDVSHDEECNIEDPCST